MPVVVAESCLAAVTKFEAADAKRVWTFIEKFSEDPSHPSLSLERLNDGKNKTIWSGRISQGLRAILYQATDAWVMIFVGKHDDAYDWVAKRQVDRHPSTGALQIINVEEVTASKNELSVDPRGRGLLSHHSDEYLISLGIAPLWLPVIREVRSEDDVLTLADKLDAEVADRIIRLATGELVTPPAICSPDEPLLKNIESRTRLYEVDDTALARLLEAPLATWTAFLHPTQEKFVTASFRGPAKVVGSAGTGKTVVALHRARHLARQGKRVLVTSYVSTLCENLRRSLRMLCTPEELQYIAVATVHKQALEVVSHHNFKLRPVDSKELNETLELSHKYSNCAMPLNDVKSEWEHVIQAQGIRTWDDYKVVDRAGRGRRLSVPEREDVWRVINNMNESLSKRGLTDWVSIFDEASNLIESGSARSPYDTVIVDEVQDLRPHELRLLALLAGSKPDSLMLVGDSGQRLYSKRLTLRSAGIDVIGRSFSLRLNYRTTRQIQQFTQGLERRDAEEKQLQQGSVRSIMDGPEPSVNGFKTASQQQQFITEKIAELLNAGFVPADVAVFARSNSKLDAIEDALKGAALPVYRLSNDRDTEHDGIVLATMHRSKGLEYKIVFVADVSDTVIPLPAAVKDVTDPEDRTDVLDRERNLLYVSCTRARDRLYVCWVKKPSQFLINQ